MPNSGNMRPDATSDGTADAKTPPDDAKAPSSTPADSPIEGTDTAPVDVDADDDRKGSSRAWRLLPRPMFKRNSQPGSPPQRKRSIKLIVSLGSAAFLTTALGLAYWEARNSVLQSYFFSSKAAELASKLEPGPSDRIRFPQKGPFDERLGYAGMPKLLERILARGYEITAQARISPFHAKLVDVYGLYPLYREKGQAGLAIFDAHQKPLFTSLYPQLVYQQFGDIPPVIVDSLLHIENRELLDWRHPFRNPVIEWDRLFRAVLDLVISKFNANHDVPGGSTLSTQIEKYRHSQDGRTANAHEKLTQMVSATFRAYLDGRNTMAARQRVVTDYINSVPLGAVPGGGEVRGIGHGLAAWHGASFQEVNELLRTRGTLDADPELLKARAKAYKEVLSLIMAQRRPAFYLQTDRKALSALVDKHLGSLVAAGVISAKFRDVVAAHDLTFRNDMIAFQPERLDFVERKGANAIRVHLLPLFGFSRLYSLDRLDLEVKSTLDYATQKEVSEILTRLKDRSFAAEAGLMGERLLGRGDPADVIYSFTLREKQGDASVLRVSADNVDGPFNVSEGGKLELGSTAKLRTLVSYLEVVEWSWRRYHTMSAAELKSVVHHPSDAILAWCLDWLRARPLDHRPLDKILADAMQRTYSANPAEAFFTGGGLHRFSNFSRDDDMRTVTVDEALRKSINLPFVRIMRDVVHHHIGRIPGSASMLSRFDDPQRREYLARFAHKEGRTFLGRFYMKYRGMEREKMIDALVARIKPTSRRLAAIHAMLMPEGDLQTLAAFLTRFLPSTQPAITGPTLEALHAEFSAPERHSLHDKGYIAGLHPLELWLVAYLYREPKASFAMIMEASATVRQEVYDWLFQSKTKARQDTRIRIMLEQEAFTALHQDWQRVGFPFATLVATYATALGSSGDKPTSLAELIGIIAAGGIRATPARIESLHFAKGTPFETLVTAKHQPGKRVLSAELAATVRSALMGVVEGGTAVRIKNAFRDGLGAPLPVGGKTGTGDNRYQIFAPGGRVIESKVTSRTATFVFFIGDKFFGTLTAYVPSATAEQYNFTSALPVQILKILAPALGRLVSPKSASATLMGPPRAP